MAHSSKIINTIELSMRTKFMRVTTFGMVTCGALIATGAFAQVEVTVPEAGRVKTTAKVENGILGVTNSFTRFRGTSRECVGACFYANTTKTKVWTCRDSDLLESAEIPLFVPPQLLTVPALDYSKRDGRSKICRRDSHIG